MTGRGRLARAARLCAVLAEPLFARAAAPAAAQTVSIASANGPHYVAGEATVVRIGGLSAGVAGVQGGQFNTDRMSLDTSGTTRQARAVYTISFCKELFVDFTYTAIASDFDTDGVSIPANSISGPAWTDISNNGINRNHAAVGDQFVHRIGYIASISSTTPAALTAGNLNGATVAVALNGVRSRFEMN